MNGFRTKSLLSPTRQSGRRSSPPFGLFALLAVAACGSSDEAAPTPPPNISNADIRDQSGGKSNTTYAGTAIADAITGNSFEDARLTNIDLDGGAGDDAISGNTFVASDYVLFITFDGGTGNDTISSNSLTGIDGVQTITFDGGAGNDTISDNHLVAAGTLSHHDVYSVTFLGGAGDDVFRNNSATQANGKLSSITIDGGDGEDTVVFRSIASNYAGISDWLDFPDGGVMTITLTGDGAAATLIDVETIAFADGAIYSAADAGVEGNGGISYDLANAFTAADTAFTAYSTDRGTIGADETLIVAGSELAHGANTILVTATASDGTKIIETITVNAVKTLKIAGAIQHNPQTGDLGDIFVANSSTTYTAANLPSGIALASGTLTFTNNAISLGDHEILITASDGTDTFTHTLTYALDAIKDQSGDESNTTYTGTNLADAITGNSFEVDKLTNVDFVGGDGDDTISSNTLTTDGDNIETITFDGGAGDDTISNNTFDAYAYLENLNFAGGYGNDSISSNTFTADDGVETLTFDGGTGDDTISDNDFNSNYLDSLTLVGDTGDDTISNNTLTADDIFFITFDGGAGDDTISDNHFESTGTQYFVGVYSVTLMGGAGDDMFRNNSATQANGASALLTIDGGEGEDTVVFQSVAGEYAGISDWINSSDGGVTTLTLTGDGAAVTLIDVETIAFADGASYSAADAGVEGNGGISYDLANAFADAGTTGFATNSGTIVSDNTLTLAGTELAHGTNTILVTATASGGAKTTETITVNVAKTLKIAGAEQHAVQTIDLNAIFVDEHTYTYASTPPSGVTLVNGTLSFNNGSLSEGTQFVTITASDGNDAFTHTLTYVLDTIQSQTVSDDGSHATYIGTTLADTITGNAFAETSGNLSFVDFVGGAGDDTISNNSLSAGDSVLFVTFDGDAGNDTISSNTITGSGDIRAITFDGGDGADTISNNHFESTGSAVPGGVHDITLIGGAGDDVFRNNTAIQANGASASLTIHGGDGADTVEFRSIAGEYAGISNWIDFSDGGVTTITLTGDGAVVTLINVETLSFADGASYSAADAGVEDNQGILYDLANAFPDADTTAYSTNSGTVGDNTLTLAGSELAHGANTIVVTATATDNTETIATITVNAVKTLKIAGAEQHAMQTIDLNAIFVDEHTYTYTSTLPSGITLVSGTLSFNNESLSEGTQSVTITATDGNDAFIHTLTYALDAIKDQSDDGKLTAYTGTTLADAITGNSFADDGFYLTGIDLDGGAGDDTISSNTLNDTNVRQVTFDGGAGDDTINNNAVTANNVFSITFDGGAGDDTIGGNVLISGFLSSITFAGGDGNDTISDNHLNSTGSSSNVFAVTLIGGAGDDVFRNNTATQANQTGDARASITIDGGTDVGGNDTDKVYFALASSLFTIKFDGGNITITDDAARTDATDGVASYAEYVLIDVEELYFAGDLYVF